MSRCALGLGLVALLFLAMIAPASAHTLQPGDSLQDVGFNQHPGQQIPAGLMFEDESGQPIRIGALFGDRPIVLTMNYFHCQNLCPLELDGLVRGLNGLPFELGSDFNVISVSIDPRETPQDGADAKARAVRGYVHPLGARGWHVLTGDHETIDRLADVVGFQYAYDAQEDDFAHPIGVVVLTPQGVISRYLYGIDFSSNDLRFALMDAGNDSIGSVADRALLVCYHYDPITGRYTSLVFQLLQLGAGLTLAAVVLGLGWLWRGELRRPRSGAA